MTNQDIAAAMRAGSALLWPSAARQCRGSFREDGGRTCFAQMLACSLGSIPFLCGSDPLNIASRAICKAASIELSEEVDVLNYIVALNEGRRVLGKYVSPRPFSELKALIETAADLLDGGEQPAREEEPATQTPIDTPPPSPPEQPTPLPTAITRLLSVEVKEKEFA